jgi:hypothetical protein
VNTVDCWIVGAALIASIPPPELRQSLISRGWDLDGMRADDRVAAPDAETETYFLATFGDYASRFAARRDAIVARRAREAAAEALALTPAARANPGRVCGKCNGKGRIRVFEHVAGGTCFQCAGAGVIEARRRP